MLAGVEPQIRPVEAVNGLQHPRVHPFDAVASQGSLGDDEGLEADEAQRGGQGRIAPHMPLGSGPRLDTPGLVFIDVHPQVQRAQVAEQDEWRSGDAGGGELSGTDFQLKHRGIHGGQDGASGDLGSHGRCGGFGDGDFGLSFHHACLGHLEGKPHPNEFILTNDRAAAQFQ